MLYKTFKCVYWIFFRSFDLLCLFLFFILLRFDLKSGSHLSKKKKKIRYLLHWKPFKNDEECFYFFLKALFVLKIFKFLPWLFSHVEKTDWLEREGQFQNLWRHNLVKKQLQYTYCPISHEVKATRQLNLVN